LKKRFWANVKGKRTKRIKLALRNRRMNLRIDHLFKWFKVGEKRFLGLTFIHDYGIFGI